MTDSTHPVTTRHGKALSPTGAPATHAPSWIEGIDNPYLHGHFAPIIDEVEGDDLEVEGELPKDLFGAYFRNGPNARHAPTNRYHWFDGDGMVHGIWFENGKARYRNRYVGTPGLKMEAERGSSIWPGVLGPFDFSLPLGPLKDTGNTDLIWFDGALQALWYESGAMFPLDGRTLQTGTGATLPGPGRLSAHSKVDPATGELIFFGYGDRPPFMWYGVRSPEGQTHFTEVELPGPRRPHDIGVTPRYSILHDFPVFFSEALFKKTGKRIPLFHPDVPTRYGVIPRHGTEVRWFEFAPCYMLHVVNCWEEGDWVVMVGCRTDDPTLKPDKADGPLASMLSGLKLQANLYEWRMNMATGESSERKLDDFNAEFPMIHPDMLGHENRYAWLQHIPYEIPATFEGLVKSDLQTGAREVFTYGPGIYGSEAPFAPRPGATAEDDGYVVTFVTDTRDWQSACWVFHGQDITSGPIAKVKLPQRVPAGFHAQWVPGDALP
ncbi:MAG: carotenoid oxygenase family protein [Bradymonadia bacterium]